MPTRTPLVASWILIVAALAACGDDEPGGAGGSGGGGAGSTTAASGGTTTSSTGAGGDASTGAGGGGGEATGGGGGEAVAHPVQIVGRTTFPDADPSETQILVNDVDGALLERFHGDELPVVVDVRDGQTITFLESLPDSWSYVSSIRVTPELHTIDRHLSARQVPPEPCDAAAPMQVVFEVPAVEGAVEIEVDLALVGHAVVTEPGPVEIEVQRCVGVETFDAMIVARGVDAILAYDVHLGIPYQPGGERVIDVVLDDAPREVLQLDLSSLAGAEHVEAYAWWATSIPETPFVEREAGLYLLEMDPPDTLTYAPALIAPGFGQVTAFARARFPGDGVTCTGASVNRRGPSAAPIALDATALRLPVATDAQGLTWAWEGDGALGDAVRRSWKVPSPDEGEWRELRWDVVDDPARPPLAAVFPELPEDRPEGFMRPGGDPELLGVGHGDTESVAGYAEAMAAAIAAEETSRGRSSHRCAR